MTQQFSIIVGSVLGATEYVADAVQACLEEKGHTATIYLEPKLSEIPTGTHWMVCTSTHGAGDLPDNIAPFAEQLEHTTLNDTKASIIGLGDSSYDTFCYGAQTMEQKLIKAGCTITHPVHTIDVLQHPIPENDAVAWVEKHF